MLALVKFCVVMNDKCLLIYTLMSLFRLEWSEEEKSAKQIHSSVEQFSIARCRSKKLLNKKKFASRGKTSGGMLNAAICINFNISSLILFL